MTSLRLQLPNRHRHQPLTIHTRRWQLTATTEGIWLEQRPNPACTHCHGEGGWYEPWGHDGDADPVQCSCWNYHRFIRLPRRGRPSWDEPPF